MEKTLIATYIDMYTLEELTLILRNLAKEEDENATPVKEEYLHEYRINLENVISALISVKFNLQ